MRVAALDVLNHVLSVVAGAGAPVFVGVADVDAVAPYTVVHLLGGPLAHGGFGGPPVESVASVQVDAVGRAQVDALWLLDRAVSLVRSSSPAAGWSGWSVSTPGGPFDVPSDALVVVGQVLRCAAAT